MTTLRRHRYRFHTRWLLDARPREVFDILTDSEGLSRW